MDFFHNAKAVRLKNHHNKYLYADKDEESVTQGRNGASKNIRWTVEFVNRDAQDDEEDNITIIRLKSCYNKYLTASNQPFLLGMTGQKVIQTLPDRLDSSVEWEPVREGNHVKLRTPYGQYLRANAGLPPWRNSVTHDVPKHTATMDYVLWDVDVVDVVVRSPAPRAPPPLVHHSTSTNSNSPAPRPRPPLGHHSTSTGSSSQVSRPQPPSVQHSTLTGSSSQVSRPQPSSVQHSTSTGSSSLAPRPRKPLVYHSRSTDSSPINNLAKNSLQENAAPKTGERRVMYYNEATDEYEEMDEKAQ